MLTLIHVLNVLTEGGKSLHELIDPLERYPSYQGLNFENADPREAIQALSEKYGDGEVDFLDGITVQYEDWWFNVQPYSDESLLRLNLEACEESILEAKLGELSSQLGKAL